MTIYIMLDTETTGLDTRSALAWDISMVALNSKYEVLEEHCAIFGRHSNLWEPSTLAFAKKTYSEDVFAAATTPLRFVDEIERMDVVVQFITKYTDKVGLKNVYLICNHVEFDWPILLNSFTRAGIALPLTGLIHYQNKLDLQSLCRGKAGKKWPEAYAEFKKVSPPVKHLALDDCISQIGMLEYFGVELP